MSSPQEKLTRVAIIGGGLAGLSAGCALAESGFRVTLFERRPYLGGRASSYEHPGTGEVVDNCQHVLLGCCTNLVDLYKRTGVSDKIRWYDRLTFLEPGGRASEIGASALPVPFHTSPSFLSAKCLGVGDKLAIARAMTALMPRLPRDTGESFLAWLQRHGQTPQAIKRFWQTVLVSALNEDLDRVSVTYAAQVFRESFLKSRQAGRMGVPALPLTELYNAAGEHIRERGGDIRLRSAVDSFRAEDSGVRLCAGGEEHAYDYAIVAVPFQTAASILPESAESQTLRSSLEQFKSSPITGIHLWLDREISDLDHAVLLDRTIQWMFHKSRILRPPEQREKVGAPSYVELVVSASKSLVEKSRAEIIEVALKELREFFPAAREANVRKSAVIKEIYATYSPEPGVDVYRPAPSTAWPRVFLAGDWTATGWPATMEGAVRSGYLAAEALAKGAGMANAKFLVPDLPATGLMRLFS